MSSSSEPVDLRPYLTSTPDYKVFLAPNTSDKDIVERSTALMEKCGIPAEKIQINYDMQLLEPGDIYASFDPPDLVFRIVYEKKKSGMVKMKSLAMIKL